MQRLRLVLVLATAILTGAFLGVHQAKAQCGYSQANFGNELSAACICGGQSCMPDCCESDECDGGTCASEGFIYICISPAYCGYFNGCNSC